jgi:predicted DNA-binding transcriptional regulator YafY
MTHPFANSIKFLTAINLLSTPQGVTIKDLMETLNISRRSSYRLLRALEDLGFPLVDTQSHPRVEKIYRLLESYVLKLPHISILNPGFTGEEIDLILSVLELCKQINERGGTSRLNTIIEKIKAVTPKEEGNNE